MPIALPLMTAEHSVDGKVVIITGSGQGIGRGMALHLGKNGASIVVAERRVDRAERTVAELEELGVPALLVPCDVSNRSDVEAVVAATVERFGRVDGLINNAQRFRPSAPLTEVTEHDLDVFYDSGVKGTLWGMQAVHPHMKAQGWGRVINFASAAGIAGLSGLRRVQRVEGGHPGPHPHRGAASGAATASS